MHHQHSSRPVKIGRWRRRTEKKKRLACCWNFKIWIILPPFARGFGSFAASFWGWHLVEIRSCFSLFLLENDYNHIRWGDFSRTKAPLFRSSMLLLFFSCVLSRTFIKCRKAAKEALKSSSVFFTLLLKHTTFPQRQQPRMCLRPSRDRTEINEMAARVSLAKDSNYFWEIVVEKPTTTSRNGRRRRREEFQRQKISLVSLTTTARLHDAKLRSFAFFSF